MFHVPNEYRLRNSIYNGLRKHYVYGSDDSYGNNGVFIIHKDGYDITILASDGGIKDNERWEHVSVSINRKRCPSWEQMCFVKDLFWDKEDCVMQYHPPEKVYVNMHPYVLHLWRAVDVEIPIPPTILVGIKG